MRHSFAKCVNVSHCRHIHWSRRRVIVASNCIFINVIASSVRRLNFPWKQSIRKAERNHEKKNKCYFIRWSGFSALSAHCASASERLGMALRIIVTFFFLLLFLCVAIQAFNNRHIESNISIRTTPLPLPTISTAAAADVFVRDSCVVITMRSSCASFSLLLFWNMYFDSARGVSSHSKP